MYKVKISDEAELDLEEAYQWYETQVNQLSSEFIRKVDDSLSSIQKNPFAYPLIYQNVRRKLLSRFPFSIFFELRNHTFFSFFCFQSC